jgi:hypothetical protein
MAFAIRDGYACYRGPVTDSAAHRHAASQVAVAMRVGLSPQRLRALSRRQLGMPLTRWMREPMGLTPSAVLPACAV